MADLPISGLPAVATPAASDEFATAQGGVTKKYTGSQISEAALTFTSLTQNSIPYVGPSGVITENNTSLTWENSAKTLSAVGIVNVNTATSVSDAVLNVYSISQGFLPPRMTTAQRDLITSPTAGLVVYDTDEARLSTSRNGVWEYLPVIETVTQTNTISGPYASPQSYDLEFVMLDRKRVMVKLKNIAVAATTNAILTIDTLVPAQFRAGSEQRQVIKVLDNGQAMFGVVEIDNFGQITIGVTANQSAFTGVSVGGNTGLQATTFTYSL